MRRILTVSVLLLAAMALILGCGGGGGDTTSGVVNVQFWHAMGGPLGDVLDELVGEFNAANADVNIESVSMGRYQADKVKEPKSVSSTEGVN